MRKIVINGCYGGFGLSDQALNHYNKISDKSVPNSDHIPRDDPNLVRVVEDMQDSANSKFSKLKIVEIPDHVQWQIMEYDGLEWIAEKHRTWK